MLDGKSHDEKKWRSEILLICIRINGKEYWEAYNRLVELDLNLILYLIKFLKLDPETAAKKVTFGEYALFCKDSRKIIEGFHGVKTISNGDVFDLVKMKKVED